MYGEASTIPFSDAHGESEPPDAVRMNGLGPKHIELSSHDVRGIARKIHLVKCSS